MLAVQSLLIVGLLYQRRARQRAESDSRRNLALAADASRRQTMSALTSSIGHELGQPLGSIMHNAQALQMMVTANRATPTRSERSCPTSRPRASVPRRSSIAIGRCFAITNWTRNRVDLHGVINESLALVAHDMEARQVKATVHLSSTPCVVSGDQVLLQQVLVNLVMNAMDAMAETPPARRHLTISSDVRTAEVDVSVRDNGSGLPADTLSTLFTPFVTTKAQGLGIGLTIARSIVHAHGGTIVARNNPEGGATFTVTLPPQRIGSILAGRLR